MNVYLPCYSGDVESLGYLLDSAHVLPLKGAGHELFVLKTHDFELPKEFAGKLGECGFDNVSVMQDNLPQGPYYASNEAFKWMCRLAQQANKTFLYLEPDCVFCDPDALDKLEETFDECGQRVLGKFTAVPGHGVHINGVAVWGAKTWDWLRDDLTKLDISKAFDDVLRRTIVPWAFPTNLIHQLPACIEVPVDADLPKAATIVHGCKDGTMLDWVIHNCV